MYGTACKILKLIDKVFEGGVGRFTKQGGLSG